jgi:hypothetical protein
MFSDGEAPSENGIVAGFRELKRHAGLLHSEEAGTLLPFPPQMAYTDSPYAMSMPSFENFGGENPSPARKSILPTLLTENANRM